MSITFYVDGQAPEKKVYCKDEWPNVPEEDFSYYDRDENGHYFMMSEWPEANFSNSNAYAIMKLAEIERESCGRLSLDELADVRRRIVGLLNREIGTVRETVREKNFISFGLDEDGAKHRLKALLEVIIKAQEEGCGISWA